VSAGDAGSSKGAAPDDHPVVERGGGLAGLGVRRPWLAVVLNLLIIVAGLAALRGIEVREFPDVDFPVVTVRADYPGASPETMDAEVTRVLEAAAARVPGVDTVRSYSEEGDTRIVVNFRPGTDLIAAANDVREAVGSVERELPVGVRQVSVVKADADADPVMQLAVSSPVLSVDALTRAIDERVEPELVAVTGVADVTPFGARQRVLRVRLQPAALAARGLAMSDVTQALATARADVPAGSLDASQKEVLVRANASLSTPADVLALRLPQGARIADVAEVFFDVDDARAYVRLDGRTVVSLEVIRQAQANSLDISRGVRAAIVRLNADNPDLDVRIVGDDARYIRNAVSEVGASMALSVAVVGLIVGLFIGAWRATLIPVVAIPISLVGTLAAMWAVGFSLNLITLLALLLATGLVVDDAIVVLENIQRLRRQGHGPRAAAVLGARQVFFAVLATTATLIAVFVPISFLPSTAGRFFAEFGFTMAFAVSISSFVALSLSPMMASRIDGLQATGRIGRHGAALAAPMARGFDRAVGWCLRHRWLVVVASLAFAAAAASVARDLPSEVWPSEDRGVLTLTLTAPDGTSLAYTDRQVDAAVKALEPLIDEGLVTRVYTVTGRWDPHRAQILAVLTDWGERSVTQRQLAERLRPVLAQLPGAQVRVSGGGSSGSSSSSGGTLEVAVTGPDYPRIAEAAFALAAAIERELPRITEPDVDYAATQPQLSLRVDRTRAADLGVPVEGLDAVLRAVVQGNEVTTLTIDGRSVPVRLEASPNAVRDAQDLLSITVRNSRGQAVPLSQFVSVSDGATATELTRHGQRRAVAMDMSLAEGLSLREAVDDVRALAARTLPEGMGLVMLGDAATLDDTARGVELTFAIALVVVFLVLVAQFENLASALVVMLTVPFGLACAAFAVAVGGVTINIFSQIGLLLLVGVVAKNGILMVEFADQLRDDGMPATEAARMAAATRLRAILMTMASTVIGALPLLVAEGPGANAQASIGWVIFGGLLLASLFTLFLAPVLYSLIAPFSRPRALAAQRLEAELARAPEASV
jgi:hydrophobic/amphiphilic exporter-1 (mainly G- bacteria), HAE1 family